MIAKQTEFQVHPNISVSLCALLSLFAGAGARPPKMIFGAAQLEFLCWRLADPTICIPHTSKSVSPLEERFRGASILLACCLRLRSQRCQDWTNCGAVLNRRAPRQMREKTSRRVVTFQDLHFSATPPSASSQPGMGPFGGLGAPFRNTGSPLGPFSWFVPC